MTSSRSKISRIPTRQKGFVLVMTLFVLAIVGLLLAQLARHSLTVATDATLQRHQTELKWEFASCQQYLLKNASKLLTDEKGEPIASTNGSLQIGDKQYDFFLTDESSKLDLNFALEFLTEFQLKQLVKEFFGQTQSVSLSPLAKDLRDTRNDAFESWGQIFRFGNSERDKPSKIFLATQDITCWSRQLNIKTAKPEIIETAIALVASKSVAKRIMNDYTNDPKADLSTLIAKHVTLPEKRQRLSRLLTTRSTSQSLWIQIKTPGRQSTKLTIRESFTSNIKRTYTFSWNE